MTAAAGEERRGPGRPRIPDEQREERITRAIAYPKRIDDLIASIADETFKGAPETYRRMVALGIATYITATLAAPEMPAPELVNSLMESLPNTVRPAPSS
jgi:hypothetical protein